MHTFVQDLDLLYQEGYPEGSQCLKVSAYFFVLEVAAEKGSYHCHQVDNQL